MGRPVEWQGKFFDSNDAPAGLSAYNIVAESVLDTYDDPTVIRIVGNLNFRLNASDFTSAETTLFAGAIGVFPEALPASASDPRDYTLPWMYTFAGEVFAPQGGSAVWDGSTTLVAGVKVGGACRQWREVFDMRAMRKVRRGEALRLAMWVDKTQGSPGDLPIRGSVRALVKS